MCESRPPGSPAVPRRAERVSWRPRGWYRGAPSPTSACRAPRARACGAAAGARGVPEPRERHPIGHPRLPQATRQALPIHRDRGATPPRARPRASRARGDDAGPTLRLNAFDRARRRRACPPGRAPLRRRRRGGCSAPREATASTRSGGAGIVSALPTGSLSLVGRMDAPSADRRRWTDTPIRLASLRWKRPSGLELLVGTALEPAEALGRRRSARLQRLCRRGHPWPDCDGELADLVLLEDESARTRSRMTSDRGRSETARTREEPPRSSDTPP